MFVVCRYIHVIHMCIYIYIYGISLCGAQNTKHVVLVRFAVGNFATGATVTTFLGSGGRNVEGETARFPGEINRQNLVDLDGTNSDLDGTTWFTKIIN